MLVRFRGGKRGIAEYLRTGKKKGREQTRDELDERVILSGDLDAVQAAIDSMVGKQERYLHISLSFREDQIPRETLREITRQFRQFALAAYRDDEALFYAEAHLPRIKSLKAEGEGGTIDRLAHIHVVIPKINLLTGGPLNPFGKVARQIPYIDAFQEVVNARFGLASPKDHRRNHFEDRSDVLSRSKVDRFQGGNRELKEAILAHILKADLRTLNDLRAYLATLGEVRVRNADSDQPYLNLKTPDASKGVNLKEAFFTREFLALSLADKEKLLKGPEVAPPSAVPGHPRIPDPQALEKVETWFRYRAREVKYLNSGNRSLWNRYLRMNEEEKMNEIGGLEARFYETHAGVTPEPLAMTGPENPVAEVEESPLVEHSDSSLGQRVVDEINRLLDEVCLSRMPKGRAFFPQRVLADLKTSHGVDAARFGARLSTASTEGVPGLYAFLRREIHWEPHSSWVYLARSGLVQAQTSQPVSREASDLLWQAFKKKKRKLEEDQELSEARRRAELSALHMSLVLSRKHLWAVAQQPRPLEWETHDLVPTNSISGADEKSPPKTYDQNKAYRTVEWTHRPLASGAVEYFRSQKRVCTDFGQKITVDQFDNQALEVVLRMAVLKWGSKLMVHGTDEFKAKVVAQASRMSLKIEFRDPLLQKSLVRLQERLER